MLNKVWFRTGIFLIILFVLIKLFMEVHSVFTPIATIIGSVFLPFLLSGFLFYICLPFQTLLEKWVSTLGKYFNYLYRINRYYRYRSSFHCAYYYF